MTSKNISLFHPTTSLCIHLMLVWPSKAMCPPVPPVTRQKAIKPTHITSPLPLLEWTHYTGGILAEEGVGTADPTGGMLVEDVAVADTTGGMSV